MRDYEFYYTQDGSVGMYSYPDNDVYHSKFGALSEAWNKFIIPSGIMNKINKTPNINVLDVCYGIGYNTKSLLSFVINQDEKLFVKKNFLKKFFEKFFRKNYNKKKDIETIRNDNNSKGVKMLSECIDMKQIKYLTNFDIDCLEMNEEIVKLSPLLKTLVTPQNILGKIIPNVYKKFKIYKNIRKFFINISLCFAPRNKKNISELLNLKFKNNYTIIPQEHKINDIVNYLLTDKINEHFGSDYIDSNFKNLIKDRDIKVFLAKDNLKYLQFKQNFIYKISKSMNLSHFLHNIYYQTLSKRNNYKKYNLLKQLFNINFYLDDARKSIQKLDKMYDYIFLDAFTFSKAPELWSVEFIAELSRVLAPDGLILTYSNSALVRNTFLENNFYLGKIYDVSSDKFIGTIASKNKSLIEHPLSNYELGLCATRAGITYHDPNFSRTKEEILKYREYEFKHSDLMTSSQYIKSRRYKNEDNEND